MDERRRSGFLSAVMALISDGEDSSNIGPVFGRVRGYTLRHIRPKYERIKVMKRVGHKARRRYYRGL